MTGYFGNHWDGLQVFLTDGRVEMDNNVVYSVNGINHGGALACTDAGRDLPGAWLVA